MNGWWLRPEWEAWRRQILYCSTKASWTRTVIFLILLKSGGNITHDMDRKSEFKQKCIEFPIFFYFACLCDEQCRLRWLPWEVAYSFAIIIFSIQRISSQIVKSVDFTHFWDCCWQIRSFYFRTWVNKSVFITKREIAYKMRTILLFFSFSLSLSQYFSFSLSSTFSLNIVRYFHPCGACKFLLNEWKKFDRFARDAAIEQLYNVSILSMYSEHFVFWYLSLVFFPFLSSYSPCLSLIRSCSLTHSSHSRPFFFFYLCSVSFENWHSIRWNSWDSFENSNQ